MAKSLRSKKKKRLRTLRRELVEPLYEQKEAAKLAAQIAAMEAPKLPVRTPNPVADAEALPSSSTAMDVEMADGGSSLVDKSVLRPAGRIRKKKLKKKVILKKELEMIAEGSSLVDESFMVESVSKPAGVIGKKKLKKLNFKKGKHHGGKGKNHGGKGKGKIRRRNI